MRSKKLLISLASATLLVLGLAACSGGSAGTDTGGSAGKPTAGGVLNVGENSDEPTVLDPHQLATTNTTILLRPVFDTLVWENDDKEIEPDLASSWDISDDGKTYTFHLRKGVTFQDGAKWNAEGLKLNFEHILDPETKSPLAASYIAPYESSKVIDDYTLEVKLKTPYSPFLNVLAQTYLSIVSPKQIKEDPKSIETHPIGSGPFKFVKWVKGQYIQLERYADYDWAPGDAQHSGPAYLKGIKFNFIAEDSVRFNAVASGDVDIIENTPPSQVDQVKNNAQLASASVDRPGHPFSFWLNTTRAPFNDQKVRQALVHAVNREQIVKTVSFGQWKTADGYITPVTPDYAKNAAEITYDADKANALLDESGWTEKNADGYRTKNGKVLEATYPNAGVNAQTSQLAELIQAAAKKVGIKITINQVTPLESSTLSQAGDFDLAAGIWTTNTADVLWIQYSSDDITTAERAGNNTSRLSNPELDELLDQARQTTDTSKRASIYEDVQKRLVDLAPAIPLYIRPDLVTYNKQKVQNVEFENAYGTLYFYDTWLNQNAG